MIFQIIRFSNSSILNNSLNAIISFLDCSLTNVLAVQRELFTTIVTIFKLDAEIPH